MPSPQDDASETRRGLLYGLAAFGWWGAVFPTMMLALNHAGSRSGLISALGEPAAAGGSSRLDWSLEIISHRILWTLLVCGLMTKWSGRWDEVWQAVRSPQRLSMISLTTLLIAGNWVGFTLGATTGQLREVSLGYYLTPLVNVALGVVLLGERLRGLQNVALLFAATGVVWETVQRGQAPWIAVLVAISFGSYGLVRKKVRVDALPGLLLEAALLAPAAIGYLIWRETYGAPVAFGRDLVVSLMLAATGIASAAPLIWFSLAARRLPLSTIAFMQYLTPTGQLLIATLLNGERLTSAAIITFSLIWIGVGAFLYDARRHKSRSKLPEKSKPAENL